MGSLYDLLGVEHDATESEIKEAFRQKSKDEHPDHGGDGEKMRGLSLAKSVLLDPHKRSLYGAGGDPDSAPPSALAHVVSIWATFAGDLRVDPFASCVEFYQEALRDLGDLDELWTYIGGLDHRRRLLNNAVMQGRVDIQPFVRAVEALIKTKKAEHASKTENKRLAEEALAHLEELDTAGLAPAMHRPKPALMVFNFVPETTFGVKPSDRR